MDEDVGTLEICAILRNGTLDRDAVVTLSTSDDTAVGKSLLFEKIKKCFGQQNNVSIEYY